MRSAHGAESTEAGCLRSGSARAEAEAGSRRRCQLEDTRARDGFSTGAIGESDRWLRAFATMRRRSRCCPRSEPIKSSPRGMLDDRLLRTTTSDDEQQQIAGYPPASVRKCGGLQAQAQDGRGDPDRLRRRKAVEHAQCRARRATVPTRSADGQRVATATARKRTAEWHAVLIAQRRPMAALVEVCMSGEDVVPPTRCRCSARC